MKNLALAIKFTATILFFYFAKQGVITSENTAWQMELVYVLTILSWWILYFVTKNRIEKLEKLK